MYEKQNSTCEQLCGFCSLDSTAGGNNGKNKKEPRKNYCARNVELYLKLAHKMVIIAVGYKILDYHNRLLFLTGGFYGSQVFIREESISICERK